MMAVVEQQQAISSEIASTSAQQRQISDAIIEQQKCDGYLAAQMAAHEANRPPGAGFKQTILQTHFV
jgi:hypothetical protein